MRYFLLKDTLFYPDESYILERSILLRKHTEVKIWYSQTNVIWVVSIDSVLQAEILTADMIDEEAMKNILQEELNIQTANRLNKLLSCV